MKQLSITDQNDVTDTIVHFCAKDVRPFSTTDGTCFTELATKSIVIGAKYGKIPATDVLPSGHTVWRHVDSVVAAEKSSLKDKIAKVSRFGVKTDGWIHDAITIPYITVTIRYTNDSWNLHSRILATKELSQQHE